MMICESCLKMGKCPIFLLFLFLFHVVAEEDGSDVYSSFEQLKSILRTERELPKVLKRYFKSIKDENLSQPVIEKLAEKFLKSRFENLGQSDEEFLKNPINIFHLIKRMTTDFRPVHQTMDIKHLGMILYDYAKSGNPLKFVGDDDLKGVAKAFERLQMTYDLNVNEISNGRIYWGIDETFKFTADDCYEMAKQMYEQSLFIEAIPWLETALQKLEKENPPTASKLEVYELLASSTFKIGHYSKAFSHIKDILKIDPDHEHSKENFQLYENMTNINEDREDAYHHVFPFEFELYRRICSKDISVLRKDYGELKCYYSTRNSSYLLIQPVKVEDVHLRPWIAFFHNILNDKEIEMVKKLALPGLERATVSDNMGNTEYSEYRIGKSAWIDDNIAVIKQITRRFQEITGLELFKPGSAEALQVLNYGIGGQYDPHHDYESDYTNTSFGEMVGGNRIATILLYLSNVEVGGDTVFPLLHFSVEPEKGGAVFWYNILKNGEGDYETLHGACPVLIGNKWVANKWIHEYHQEFRRLCGLSKQDIY